MLNRYTVRTSISTFFLLLAFTCLYPSTFAVEQKTEKSEAPEIQDVNQKNTQIANGCHWIRSSPNCGPHADYYYYGPARPQPGQAERHEIFIPPNADPSRYSHYFPYPENNNGGFSDEGMGEEYAPTNTNERWFYRFPSWMEDQPAPVPPSEDEEDSQQMKDLYSDTVTLPRAAEQEEETTQTSAEETTQVPDQPHLYTPPQIYRQPNCGPEREGYTINFEDISVIQLVQFISKIAGTNYIFDSQDLQFNISIVSEDETSVTDLSAALLQVLKIHGLSVVEQGNNVLIYKDQNMSKVSTVITEDNVDDSCDSAIITRVFRMFNVDVEKVAPIVQSLISPQAIVDSSIQTRHLVVTDITANVNKIAELLAALDTPNITIDVSEYQVNSAYPEALAAYARQILEPFAQGAALTITAEPGSRKIFVVGNPYLISKATQVLSSLDVPEIVDTSIIQPLLDEEGEVIDSPETEQNNFYMYKLKYQSGQEIAQALREIGTNLQSTGISSIEFVNTINSLQWVQVNNSVIITGTNSAIEKVVELLDDLDQPPKQVYVEVLVIDTELSNSLDFGVQWIALGDEQNKLAYASGLLSDPPPNINGSTSTNPGARFVAANPASGPPSIPNPGRDVPLPLPSNLNGQISSNFTSAFGFGIIGNILKHNGQSFLTLGALVSALDEEQDTTIVLNPRVMVEDTQKASFFVGQNIPFQTTSTVIQQTGSVTQNIQYEDVGVQLQVTPTIAPNNVVTLQIDQVISELSTAVGNLTPTTDKRLVTTRVHVPDGTFLVMSGHIRDRCDYIRSGIPCLGTLPLIGPTFSRTIEQRQKRNLIFFIRPKVVSTIQEGIDLTNQEGYDYNWESNPCSIIDCDMESAPECEVFPPYRCN